MKHFLKTNKPVRVSVVVCTYNGSCTIKKTLSALKNQTYTPLEVIVVNDCSTDNTMDILKQFSFRVITNAKNLGLSNSRNIGIKHSRGEIVAFTDDDCIPEREWIEQLILGYQDPEVIGVGGVIRVAGKPSLVLSYLQEKNPLVPLSTDLFTSTNMLYRFFLYLRSMFYIRQYTTTTSVYSLVGANMSFRKQILDSVGGFDPAFRFAADEEDLCKRLHLLPHTKLLYTPSAIVNHVFASTFADTLRRNYLYGFGSARMFCKHKDMNPTIFPFPLLVLFLFLLGFVFPFLFFLSLLLPVAVYPNWIIFAFIRRKPRFLLFPYMQLVIEGIDNIGFLKGFLAYNKMYT